MKYSHKWECQGQGTHKTRELSFKTSLNFQTLMYLWHSLPQNVVEARSLEIFKVQLGKHLKDWGIVECGDQCWFLILISFGTPCFTLNEWKHWNLVCKITYCWQQLNHSSPHNSWQTYSIWTFWRRRSINATKIKFPI